MDGAKGYAEVLEGSAATARSHERRAFDHAVALLEQAARDGRTGRAGAIAILFVQRLWTILLEDLAGPDNGLPEETRAGLISTGIWVLKEVDRVRLRETDDLDPLIDIHRIVAAGLA